MNKKVAYKTSLDKLKLSIWYESGIMASVDWVAGGNFDGYVYKKLLMFHQDGRVDIRVDTVCSRTEGYKEVNIQQGTYSKSYKGSFQIIHGDTHMNGYVLGDNDSFIAFEVTYPKHHNEFIRTVRRNEAYVCTQ